MTAKAVPTDSSNDSANDRFKASFGNWFWGSMIAATVIHAGAFAFWPEMTAEDFSMDTDEIEMIDLPPEIEIPPPPEQIARPATPVITEATIERLAGQFGIAILTPDGDPFGWYLDSPLRSDSQQESYLIEELLPDAEASLGLHRLRRSIAGLSMGGHGALGLSLKHPRLFRSASSMSG